MDSVTFFKLLDEYLIEDLVSLENRIEGLGVFVEEDPERYVELVVERVMQEDVTQEEITKNYLKFSYVNPGLPGETYFQSLNYEKFLPFKNGFQGVVSYYLDIHESRVLNAFIEYLNYNLDNTIKSKIFVSKIMNSIQSTTDKLRSGFSKEGEYKIYTYQNIITNPTITGAITEVLDRALDLLERLKEEYNTYQESNKEENESQQSKNTEEKIWYKIAKLIALGRLRYEDSKFIFDGIRFNSGTKTAEPISIEIGEKANSVRPFLTETLSNSYSTSNNNIFLPQRYAILKGLMEKIPPDSISQFFEQKIKEIENSTNSV